MIYPTACGHISEDHSFKLRACYTSEMLGATHFCVLFTCVQSAISLSLSPPSLSKEQNIEKLVNNVAICAVLCQAGFMGKCDIHK